MNNFLFKTLFLSLSLLFISGNVKAELSPEDTLTLVSEEEDQAWPLFFNDTFFVRFPTPPATSHSKDVVCYSAADTSSFPISVYSVTSFKPHEHIDSSIFIDNILDDFNHNHQLIIWSEVNETNDGVVLELLTSEKYTSVMRKDKIFIFEDEVYVLTTLFYPIGIDNHDYFTNSFVLQP